jgi:hypothetical protein
MVYVEVRIPYDRGDLAALFHAEGTILRTAHEGQGTMIEGYLPKRWVEQFRPYLI